MLTNFKGKLERFCFRNLRKIFATKGYYLGRTTPKENIEFLIKSLQPVSTDKKLIRIGEERDGGYLVPNDLEGIEACFSPGVGSKSKFEEDCLGFGMKVFLADASVDGLPTGNNLLHFTKKFIGAVENDEFMTLDSWINSIDLKPDSDLLLQMDIEGFEYLALTNISDKLLERFRLIVMEVHHLDHLWGEDFFQMASTSFDKLLKNHSCVHIHPNNTSAIAKINGIEIAPTIEITFLRNDRIVSKSPATQFPHHLDTDNTNRESVILPKNWIQS